MILFKHLSILSQSMAKVAMHWLYHVVYTCHSMVALHALRKILQTTRSYQLASFLLYNLLFAILRPLIWRHAWLSPLLRSEVLVNSFLIENTIFAYQCPSNVSKIQISCWHVWFDLTIGSFTHLSYNQHPLEVIGVRFF